MRNLLTALLLGLLSMSNAHAQIVADSSNQLFEYDGTAYSPKDLSPRMVQLLSSFQTGAHQSLVTLIDEILFDVYVEQQGKKENRSPRAIARKLLDAPLPDEAAARVVYDKNKERFGAKAFDEVKADIQKLLLNQARKVNRDKVIARLKEEGKFKLLVTKPSVLALNINSEGYPFKGDKDAKVTIVEFSDFQCQNCQRAAIVMQTLLSNYPKGVKVVYMDFPVNPTGISRQVSIGGVCADNQGKFWNYHDLAFNEQFTLTKESPLAIAKELGLDEAAFSACLTGAAATAKVTASFQEARRLGLNATPSVFVDGKPFPSRNLYKDLVDYIDEALGKKS